MKYVEVSASSDDRKLEQEVLWRDSTLLQSTLSSPDPNRTLIPVYFNIPFDCQSSRKESDRSILWFLKVGPDGAEGLAQYAQFEVPVFKTDESSPNFEPDPDMMRPFEVPLKLQTVLDRSGCRVEVFDDGTKLIRFSNFRPAILFQGLSLVAVLAIAGSTMLFYVHPLWSVLPGLFAMLVVLAVGDMCLWASRIHVGAEEIKVVAGLLGFSKKLSVTRDAIDDIVAGVEFAMRERTAYGLRLRTVVVEASDTEDNDDIDDDESGDDIEFMETLIARRIASQSEAELLRRWLADQLGLEANP